MVACGLLHQPPPVVLYHPDHYLLVKAVTETEHEVSVGYVSAAPFVLRHDGVVDAVKHSHLFYAVVLVVHPGDKHLRVGFKLLGIAVRNGIRQLRSCHEIRRISGKQRVVILFCHACGDVPFLLFGARDDGQNDK